MKTAQITARGVAVLLAALCSGCYMWVVGIEAQRTGGTFSTTDERAAVLAVSRTLSDLGYRPAPDLAPAEPGTTPYRILVVFLPPRDQPIQVVVEINAERTAFRASLLDYEHGHPRPEFEEALSRVRKALDETFPDARFKQESARVFRFFAP